MEDKPNQPQKQSFLKQAADFTIIVRNYTLDIWQKLGDLEKTNLELGIFHLHHGNYFDAAFRFRLVLWVNRNNKSANYLLGKTYIYAEKFHKAIPPLRRALLKDPKHEEAKFLLAICGEKLPIEKIPASFIEEQLDLIAPNYEKLVTEVHSKINSEIKKMLVDALGAKQGFDILVLPARGGDVGEILLDRANKTIGVESCLPLAGAARTRRVAEKLVFNEVLTRDPPTYLKSAKTKFDVIISTFFIPFFGDVTNVLKNLAKLTKKRGLLIISFEQNEEKPNYELSKISLGFTHSPDYIRGEIKKAGFKIIAESSIELTARKELIMLLEKK